MDFQINENSLKILNNKKLEYDLPFLWLRDNCPCNECRVQETQEKRFMIHSIPADLKPKSVNVDKNTIYVQWPDDHRTCINFKDIKILKKTRKPNKVMWTNSFTPNYYDWSAFLENNEIAVDAYTNFISTGAFFKQIAPVEIKSV